MPRSRRPLRGAVWNATRSTDGRGRRPRPSRPRARARRTQPALCSPGHGPYRSPLGHRHPSHRRDARRDGRGRGRRRRVRATIRRSTPSRPARPRSWARRRGCSWRSGTMGNLVSLMAHLPRGYEAIAGASTHTVIDEAGGHAVVVGATIRALPERPDGTMDPAAVADAWRDPTDLHEPLTGLVILEQTHAHSGGRPLPLDYVRTIARDRPRARRPAPHRRRAVLQRHGRPRRRARARWPRPPTRSRSACRRACRPRSDPWSSARRRSSPGRAARASSSAAGCARSASSRRPASRAGRRPGRRGRADRPPRGRPRQRPPARRAGSPDLDGIRSPGGIAQPDELGERLDPGAHRDQLRPVPRRPGPGAPSSTPSRRGTSSGPVRARPGPCGDAPRRHRRRHRPRRRRGGRGPARDTLPARPASRPTERQASGT